MKIPNPKTLRHKLHRDPGLDPETSTSSLLVESGNALSLVARLLKRGSADDRSYFSHLSWLAVATALQLSQAGMASSDLAQDAVGCSFD